MVKPGHQRFKGPIVPLPHHLPSDVLQFGLLSLWRFFHLRYPSFVYPIAFVWLSNTSWTKNNLMAPYSDWLSCILGIHKNQHGGPSETKGLSDFTANCGPLCSKAPCVVSLCHVFRLPAFPSDVFTLYLFCCLTERKILPHSHSFSYTFHFETFHSFCHVKKFKTIFIRYLQCNRSF